MFLWPCAHMYVRTFTTFTLSLHSLFLSLLLQELQEIIELDIVNFDMFDLAPVSEYEVYMRSFGQRDCSQVAVQAGEDTVDTDAQTEEIILQSVWTQHPQEGSTAVGRENGE